MDNLFDEETRNLCHVGDKNLGGKKLDFPPLFYIEKHVSGLPCLFS